MRDALGLAADVMSVLAFVGALLALWSRFLARPRVDVRDVSSGQGDSLWIDVTNSGRSAPLRNLRYSQEFIDNQDHSWGDGSQRWVDALASQESGLLIFHGSRSSYAAPLRPNERRLELLDECRFVLLHLSWQHSMVPWWRQHRYVSWARGDGAEAVLHPGIDDFTRRWPNSETAKAARPQGRPRGARH